MPNSECQMPNEKRLIDAAPLMEDGWHLVKTGKSNVFLASMSLADVQTVDAVPVVHGRWIDSKGNVVAIDTYGCPVRSCNCSVCGDWLTASDEYACVGNYCPNCGADMRDGERREGE